MNLYTVVILSKLTVTSNKNIGKLVLKRIVFNNLYSKLNININFDILVEVKPNRDTLFQFLYEE